MKEYLKLYFWDIVSKHYFDFKGREGRKKFWLYTLNTFLLNMVLYIISEALCVICGLVLILPSLGMTVRRLHDIDFRGWWVLISFIPIIGSIALIIMECLPGTVGDNRFGAEVSVPVEKTVVE